MKKQLTTTLAFCLLSFVSFSQLSIKNPRIENRTNPIGIDEVKPRFSWILDAAERRNVMQTAYEIKVGTEIGEVKRGKNLVWNSGRVKSSTSILVPYNGPALKPGTRYFWQVRVWDNAGQVSVWSEVAFWQTGLLDVGNWKADWIGINHLEDSLKWPSPIFRKEFSARKNIKMATAYISARGLYEAQINGQRVGDAYLTPGWTAYQKRIQYQVYDVTNLLKPGENAIGVTLGSGWFRSYLAWSNNRETYGKELSLLLQMDIEYEDGTHELVLSDGSWRHSTGGILDSEIYHGETIDARLEQKGWTMTGFKDNNWEPVKVVESPKATIVATYNEPIRKQERFTPQRIFTTPKGERIIDFGQNLVGWVEVKARGASGSKIQMVHAEVLDKFGNFYTENLRVAKQTCTYTLAGTGGVEFFEPHFTFQGFRYVQVVDFPGELAADNFTAVALYSDMPKTGNFTSSNPLVNQLQHNIQWGQRGNFLDVPTDCPQRDERLGWTGDAQAFARTAAFNHEVHAFYMKWLKDVALDQRPDGSVPFVVPNVLGDGACGSAGWADVATILPWDVYIAYGDQRVLENQYTSMKAWVDYMTAQSEGDDLWNSGFLFGDWLFYSENNDNIGNSAVTYKPFIQQCFWAHSTQLLINAANVLGKKTDVTKYTALLQRIKSAFNREYVTPNGALVSATQTAYVLALNFDMLPENLREQAAQRLVDNIRSYNTHLTTGFLGTPYLCHVLTRFGHDDVAYELFLREKYPSWLYPVTMGATTIWERWDGIRPDSTFEEASMNSFNHYAYGAIGDWMYRSVAGLNTEEQAPGYKQILIKPHIGASMTEASADLMTPYGRLASGWKTEPGFSYLHVEIPANTTATIYVPSDNLEIIREGSLPISAGNFQFGKAETGYTVLKDVGSGIYDFSF
ncbi:MAG: Bacterial alpha-L-rhamnosidase [Bacteroidetes bacterium]|nr:Bacterial alpha-L-rhamnosidase [Bacteroidota bacterium]